MKRLSIYFLLSIGFFSLNAKTIAFLNFEDETKDGKGLEKLELVISSIFPNERFNLISKKEVNKVLSPRIQKELMPITAEIAWTIGEVLGCDVICVGSIEEKYLIRFFFIETRKKRDLNLADEILDAFLSYFGINCKIEKLISPSELIIPLGETDGVKIGDRFDVIRDGKRIAEAEVISIKPSSSYLSLIYAKEKISPFDIIRKSTYEIKKTHAFLLINTKPNASISWKGSNLGESPIIINDKISGELSISKEGFRPLKIDIEEKGYPESILDLSLFLLTLETEEKKPCSLSVSSLPNNCEVFLDGRFIGLTPLFIPHLEEKLYDLVVKKEGFSPYSKKILVKQEEELRINLYPIPLEEKPPPPKEKTYLSELILFPTSHCLKRGELELGLVYPELFKLNAALPGTINAELNVFGIGCGLKYNIISPLGIYFYYKAFDLEKNEKKKDFGFWFIGSLNSKFFNIHLGGGENFQDRKGQYFLGLDKDIKWTTLLAEYGKDRFSIGCINKIKGFEIKTAIGKKGKKAIYNLGVYLKRGQY